MSETKLKPCPFCGGEAVIHTVEPHKHLFVAMPAYGGGTFIECSVCTCAMSGRTEQETIEAWNTRGEAEEYKEPTLTIEQLLEPNPELEAFLQEESPYEAVFVSTSTEGWNCNTCANYTDFDEVDNGCYLCCKGLENNYEPKE